MKRANKKIERQGIQTTQVMMGEIYIDPRIDWSKVRMPRNLRGLAKAARTAKRHKKG